MPLKEGFQTLVAETVLIWEQHLRIGKDPIVVQRIEECGQLGEGNSHFGSQGLKEVAARE
jgi:hypothetical protein